MTMDKPKRDHRQRQSLFWPIILIGIGLIWLLNNLGILSTANIAVLFRLWPLFLIIIGLDMLIGRDSPRLRPLLGIGAVVLLVVLAIIGPSLGLSGGQDVETRVYDVEVAGAEAAEFRMDASSAPVNIRALTDSANLAEMQIVDSGRIDMEYVEGVLATISLDKRADFGFGFFAEPEGETRRWDIGLSDRVPLNLDLELASGNSQLDLSALSITDLKIDAGSGNVALKLPGGAYRIESEHGSGRWVVEVPPRSAFDWQIDDLGSGNLTINVAASVGVQVEIQDSDSGALNVPPGWEQMSGDDEEGVWQSGNYAGADYVISITIADRSSGNMTFRQ